MDKNKLKEIFLYLFFGVLTTVVSLAVYYGCVFTFLNPENPVQLQAANIISWILAVIFAYITNRIFVFKSKSQNIVKEAAKFFAGRIFSLLVDMLIMFVFVSVLKLNDKIIKIVSQIAVIVLNYIISKIFVFKNGDSSMENSNSQSGKTTPSNSILKKIFSFRTVLIVFFAVMLVCILPFSRNLILNCAEKLLHRSLQDMTKWNAVITYSCMFFAVLSVFTYFFMYIKKGTETFKQIKSDFSAVFTKSSIKYTLTIFAIYILGYFTILRANYDYQDDIKRIIAGHKSWIGASRYVSETLSVFFHTNFYLNDIAPVPQIIALLILAFSSYLLAYIVTGGKVTKLSCAVSTVLGLCPFYIENMAYKFDAPYMAISVFCEILPFIFTENLFAFASVSVVSMTFSLTSYQAANSIYIILAIFCVMKQILKNQERKSILKFTGTAVLSYAIALVLFRVLIMIPTEVTISERDTTTGGLAIFGIMKANFTGYFKYIACHYGNLWIKLFTIIAIVLFPVTAAFNSENKKIRCLCISVLALILMTALSFGAYLVIGNTVIHDRAFMGFDALMAVILLADVNFIFTGRKLKIFAGITAGALLWGFFINTIVMGNLLSKQQKYQDFRYTILLEDLSEIINPEEENQVLVLGGIGPATNTNMEYKNYPIENFGRINDGWTQYLIQYWNMDMKFLAIESYDDMTERKPELAEKISNLSVLKDTYYHKISSKTETVEKDGKSVVQNTYLIELKNPQVEEYKIRTK